MKKAMLLLLAAVSPFTAATPLINIQGAEGLMNELTTTYGFDQAIVKQWFSAAEFRQDALDLLAKPVESTTPIKQYKPLFVNEYRLKAGVNYYNLHKETLLAAEAEYGVPWHIMLAIIGMETNFGGYMGKHKVFEALATLALQHPREGSRGWFTREFYHYVTIARDQGLDPLSVKGSYTGAMGLPQFMPSSYKGYAVDFNNDGKTDIWNDPADAIGSVGNYLLKNGWQVGEQIVVPASISGEQFESVRQGGAKIEHTWAQVKAAGWSINIDNIDNDKKVLPFRIDAENGYEYWLGDKNFYVITRYNHSIRYAMTAWMLAEAIKTEVTDSLTPSTENK